MIQAQHSVRRPLVSNEVHDKPPHFVTIDKVEAHDTLWLWPGRVPAAAVTIVEGDPSAGKSTLLSALAAAVTTGRPWIDRPGHLGAGVLWLTSEEDPGSTIRQRLVADKASLDLVRVLDTSDNSRTV